MNNTKEQIAEQFEQFKYDDYDIVVRSNGRKITLKQWQIIKSYLDKITDETNLKVLGTNFFVDTGIVPEFEVVNITDN